MSARRCVAERVPAAPGDIARTATVWHIDLNPRRLEADWTPIACGEGITYPGSPVTRQPTCPQCIAAAKR